MYLTSSVKRSLFSTGVDIWWESGVLAQPLLHLSSLSLFLPLTPSAPIWAASLQGGERKKVANLALLSHFQGHFVSLRDILTLQAPCGAADLVVCPRGWQTQWHSPTHWWPWVSMPQGLHAALGTGANPSPQCSTVPHSCCLALKPLMGTCTAQKKPFIRYSLQDVSIQCEMEAGRQYTHTESEMALG